MLRRIFRRCNWPEFEHLDPVVSDENEGIPQVGAAIVDFLASQPTVECLVIHQHYEGGDPAVIYPFSVMLCVSKVRASDVATYIADADEYSSELTPEWVLLSKALDAAPQLSRELLTCGSFQFVAAMNRGWNPTRYVRVGPWAASSHWSDDALLRLACGFESDNGMYLQFVASPKNQVDWRFRVAQVAELFEPDTRLQKLAMAVLEDFAARHHSGVIGFTAFYPEDLLLAVCSPVLAAGDKFSPRLEVFMLPSPAATEPANIVRFILCWDLKTNPSSAQASLDDIYGGVEPYYVVSALHDHFSYRSRFLKKLGFRWRAFEASVEGKNGHELTLAKGRIVRRPVAPHSVPFVKAFIEANWNWVCDVVTLLAAFRVEVVAPIGPDTYFQERPHKCDLCGRAFAAQVYDALVPPTGVGAFMCRECFHFRGCSAWSPYWDEFTKLPDGKWYLTKKYQQDG